MYPPQMAPEGPGMVPPGMLPPQMQPPLGGRMTANPQQMFMRQRMGLM
jgi:hypothetical protein